MMRRVARATQPAEDPDGTRLVRRPPAAPAPAPAPPPAPRQEKRGSFDLGAWVHGMMSRPEETPSEPFKQGVVRRDRPDSGAHAKPRPPRRSLDDQGLARWAFGLAGGKDEEAPPPPPRRPAQRSSARRKALTMPDLFDGGAVPPCLQDD